MACRIQQAGAGRRGCDHGGITFRIRRALTC